MTGYVDWTQAVFRAALRERQMHASLTIEALAADVGLPLDGLPAEERNDRLLSLDRVLRDLAAWA